MSLQTYPGNCHCGAFRFTITCPPITIAKSCNCSICTKKQYLFLSLPVSRFEITRGEEGTLTSYEFGAKTLAHKFCPICGTGILIRPLIGGEEEGKEVRINVRTLLDIDPFRLKTENLQPEYVHPKFQGELFDLMDGEPGMKIYTGGCHCGAVTVAVKSKPLPEVEVREDNCSICRRNGNTSIYPTQSFVRLAGAENTTSYLFDKKYVGHPFCRICGVQVYMKVIGPKFKEEWSEEVRRMVREKCEIVPVRMAVFEGVGWDEWKVERSDEGTQGTTCRLACNRYQLKEAFGSGITSITQEN